MAHLFQIWQMRGIAVNIVDLLLFLRVRTNFVQMRKRLKGEHRALPRLPAERAAFARDSDAATWLAHVRRLRATLMQPRVWPPPHPRRRLRRVLSRCLRAGPCGLGCLARASALAPGPHAWLAAAVP